LPSLSPTGDEAIWEAAHGDPVYPLLFFSSLGGGGAGGVVGGGGGGVMPMFSPLFLLSTRSEIGIGLPPARRERRHGFIILLLPFFFFFFFRADEDETPSL